MRDPDVTCAGREMSAGGQLDDTTSAASIGRLKRRADFLRVGKGRRWHGKGFSMQVAATSEGEADAPRVGFTVTKKVGCSVIRNRARRRLREALRVTPGLPLRPGHDYVVVARLEAIRLSFATLQNDLVRGLRSLHGERQADAGSRRPGKRPATRSTERPAEGKDYSAP